MKYSLLTNAGGTLWLINTKLTKSNLEAGLAVGFPGLPASFVVFDPNCPGKPVATLLMPEDWQKIPTSAAEADVVFELGV